VDWVDNLVEDNSVELVLVDNSAVHRLALWLPKCWPIIKALWEVWDGDEMDIILRLIK
jgi:hypothetical protein